MSIKDALQYAEEHEVDLIKIAPTAKPPVCKAMDFGKYRYEQTRREKDAKKKQKVTEIKEIRLSPNIDDNDLNTKASQAAKFISHGDRVKVSLRFRGREMAHMNAGKEILDDFYEKINYDICKSNIQPKKVFGPLFFTIYINKMLKQAKNY